jgi:transcriptional regulator PpsR
LDRLVNKKSPFLYTLDMLADVDTQTVKSIVAAGSDIALLITADGIVEDVYMGPDTPPANDVADWSGARIDDIVTEESRGKIDDMLAKARTTDAPPRWREINHVSPGEDDFPVRYAAVRTGSKGDVILLGRDLRVVAQLHKRLVEAQLTMEQDYERIRQIETRYRVLFETTHEALLIVSSETGRIIDANSAAARLFSREVEDLTNRVFANRFEPKSQSDLAVALAMVRESGRERSIVLTGRGEVGALNVDLLLFRSVNETLYLCRLTSRDGETEADRSFDRSLSALYGRTSDAMVFTDSEGRIRSANTAFLGLADVAVGRAIEDINLTDFLGRPSVDLNLLMSNARVKGRLSAYNTTLRTTYGMAIPIEISTTWLPEADPPMFGFVIRDVSRATPGRGASPAVSSEAVENIIDLVGTTPLKELVRGTTDVVEKLCIETAIKLTNNNRASAAEMLGLSRQSLYVKLRKYGLIAQDD